MLTSSTCTTSTLSPMALQQCSSYSVIVQSCKQPRRVNNRIHTLIAAFMRSATQNLHPSLPAEDGLLQSQSSGRSCWRALL